MATKITLGNQNNLSFINTTGTSFEVTVGNGNNDFIQLGNGDDKVTAGNGNGYTLILGNGNNTVVVGNGGSRINNTVNMITTGSGNDTITVGNGDNTISSGNGNDKITVGSGRNIINVGSGSDTIKVSSSLSTSTDTINITGSNTVTSTDLVTAGDALINLTVTGKVNLTAQVGNANNLFNLSGSTGVDKITFGDGANTVLMTSNTTVTGGKGANTINIGASEDSIVTLKDGNNIVTIGTGSDNTVKLGNGANTVTVGTGSNNVVTLGTGANSIDAGAGSNTRVTGSGSYIYQEELNALNPSATGRTFYTGSKSTLTIKMSAGEYNALTLTDMGGLNAYLAAQIQHPTNAQFVFQTMPLTIVGFTKVNYTILNLGGPAAPTLSFSTIQENAAAGTLIGTLSTTDPNVLDTITWSLSGINASDFTITSVPIAPNPKGITTAQATLKVAPGGGLNNFTGTESVTVILTDLEGNSVSQSVNVKVAPTSPNSATQTYVGTQNTLLAIVLPSQQMSNAGDSFSYQKESNPTHGTLVWNTNGMVSYTPTLGFFGTDSFTYTVTDYSSDLTTSTTSATTTASITITAGALLVTPLAANIMENNPASLILSSVTGYDVHNTLSFSFIQNGNTLFADNTGTYYTLGGSFTAPGGVVNYTVRSGFTGTDSFTEQVTETAQGGSQHMGSALLSVAVTPIAPGNLALTFFGAENAVLNASLNTVSINVNNGLNVFNYLFNQPSHGVIVKGVYSGGTQAFSYTPNAGFFGTDTFTYTVIDTSPDGTTSSFQTVMDTLKIAPNPLVLTPLANSTMENSGAVLLNAISGYDVHNILSFSFMQNGNTLFADNTGTYYTLGGSFTAPGGVVSYTPNTGFTGTDVFVERVTETAAQGGAHQTETEVLSVAVTPIAPGNQSLTFFGAENAVLNASLNTVSPNVNNGLNVFSYLFNQPSYGVIVKGVYSGGTQAFSYTPNAGFFGTDTFSYTVIDTSPDGTTSSFQTVVDTLKIAPTPLVLTPLADTTTENSGAILLNAVSGYDVHNVLSFSFTQNGNTLFADNTGTYYTLGGSFTAPGGVVSYTPNTGFTGTDVFVEHVTETAAQGGAHQTETEVFSVTVTPGAVTDLVVPPIVSASIVQAPTLGSDPTVLNLVTSGYNASTQQLSIAFTQEGIALPSFTLNGQLLYTLPLTPALIPVVNTIINTPAIGILNAILAELAVTNYIPIISGVFLVDPDGTLHVEPTTTFNGTIQFTAQITENFLGGNPSVTYPTQSASVVVTPVPLIPLTQTFQATEGTPYSDNLYVPSQIGTNNAIDIFTFVISKQPTHGTISIGTYDPATARATFTYTPDEGFLGTDSFSYTVSETSFDGTASSVQTFSDNTITVSAPVFNPTPLPLEVSVVTKANNSVILDLINGGLDPSASQLNFAFMQGANTLLPDGNGVYTTEHGTFTVSAAGLVIYTPTHDFSGPDDFTAQVTSNSVTHSEALSVTVNPAPLPQPVQYFTTVEGQDYHGNLPTYDINPNESTANSFVYNIAIAPSHGTVTLGTYSNGNESFTYAPNAGFTGADSFTYNAEERAPNGTTVSVRTVIENITVVPTGVTPMLVTANTTQGANSVTPLMLNLAPSGYNPSTDQLSFTFSEFGVQLPSTTLNGQTFYAPPITPFAISLVNALLSAPPIYIFNGILTLTALTGSPVVNSLFSVSPDGILSIQPTATFNGTIHLTAQVTQTLPGGGTNTFFDPIDIVVLPAPLGNSPQTVTTTEGSIYVGNLPTQSPTPPTFNGINAFSDTFTYTITEQPLYGTILMGGYSPATTSGSFIYTPNNGFFGTDSFTYTVTDTSFDGTTSSTVTVSGNVIHVSNATVVPAMVNATSTENNVVPTTLDLITSGYSPAKSFSFVFTDEGNMLSPNGSGVYTTMENGQISGKFTVSAGVVNYTPAAGFYGTDDFAVQVTNVSSGGGATDYFSSTLSVDVIAPPSTPIVNTATGSIGSSLIFLGPITTALPSGEPFGTTLSLRISDLPTGATLINGSSVAYSVNGGVWSVPFADASNVYLNLASAPTQSSSEILHVTAAATENGVSAFSPVANLTVNLVALDPPTLTMAAASGVQNGGPISLSISVTVPPGATLITPYAITISNVHGVFNHGTNLGGGAWGFSAADLSGLTFTPTTGFNGTDALVVSATDTQNGVSSSVSQTLNVQVAPITPGSGINLYYGAPGTVVVTPLTVHLPTRNTSGDPIHSFSFTLVDGPDHATNFSLSASGLVTYVGNMTYIENSFANNLPPVDSFTYRVTDTSPDGTTSSSRVNQVLITYDTHLVYVSDSGSNQVSVIGSLLTRATATVGIDPYGSVYNPYNGSTYIANLGSNSISVLNGGSDTVATTIFNPLLFDEPGTVLLTPATATYPQGELFVLNIGDTLSPNGSIVAIDPSTNGIIRTYFLDGHAASIPEMIFDSADGLLIVGSEAISNGNVYSAFNLINITTNEQHSYYNPNPNVTSAAGSPIPLLWVNDAAGDNLWLVNYTNGSVTNFTNLANLGHGSTANATSTTIAVGSHPDAIVSTPFVDGGNIYHFVYVANYGSGTVTMIDNHDDLLNSNPRVLGNPISVGVHPIAMEYNPTDSLIYVANFSSASVSVFNAGAINPSVTTINVGPNPSAIYIDADPNDNGGNESYIYVTNSGAGTVSVIDSVPGGGGVALSVIATISVGTLPSYISGDSAGGHDIVPLHLSSVTNQTYTGDSYFGIANYGDSTSNLTITYNGQTASATVSDSNGNMDTLVGFQAIEGGIQHNIYHFVTLPSGNALGGTAGQNTADYSALSIAMGEVLHVNLAAQQAYLTDTLGNMIGNQDALLNFNGVTGADQAPSGEVFTLHSLSDVIHGSESGLHDIVDLSALASVVDLTTNTPNWTDMEGLKLGDTTALSINMSNVAQFSNGQFSLTADAVNTSSVTATGGWLATGQTTAATDVTTGGMHTYNVYAAGSETLLIDANITNVHVS